MSTIFSEGTIKKTRSTHLCCVCGEWIPRGESCSYQANTVNGPPGTAYWHSYHADEEIKEAEEQ